LARPIPSIAIPQRIADAKASAFVLNFMMTSHVCLCNAMRPNYQNVFHVGPDCDAHAGK
jgi:hypothetical protein